MNVIHLTAENPDELLNASAYGPGAIIRVQSGPAEAGPFASETTVALAPGTRSYVAYDADGTSSTWYQTRFENAGGTIVSAWSDAFQAGDEFGGLICSLYDVKQRLGIPASDTTKDEDLLEAIRQVGAEIMGYTKRRFVRDPLSGEATLLFDVGSFCRELRIPAGIASASVLEVATVTGGAFSTVPTSDWFLDPPEAEREFGWPATRITLSDVTTGPISTFWPGKRVVRITMALGFEAVPSDIQNVAIGAAVRNQLAKGSPAGVNAIAGPSGALVILRGIGPADLATLDRYRVVRV